MAKVSKTILVGYNNCVELATKWVNILDSYWHKDEPIPISSIQGLSDLSNSKVSINDKDFILVKHPDNSADDLEVNDMILNGWWSTTEFWKQALYTGGTITDSTSWNVIDSIEEIPLN